MQLLHKYVLNNKPINFQVYGEKEPNFANENMKIGLPIYSIHGNHDYPSTNFGNISVLDLLSLNNLVNKLFFTLRLITLENIKKMTE